MFKTFIQELRKKHRTNAQISDKFRNLAKICPNTWFFKDDIKKFRTLNDYVQLYVRINILSEMQSSHRQGKMPEAFFPLGNNVKNPDRNLSGKSDKRDIKLCKT